MEPSRTSNLISDYIQYCREHQNIISSALNDLRDINSRMADFVRLEANSRNSNDIIELSRALENINRNLPPENTRQNTTQNSNRANTTPPTQRPPPTQPTPPTQLPPPPPPPPPPPSNPLPIPGVVPYPSENEMNQNENETTTRRENNRNRHIFPVSTRILRTPTVRPPPLPTQNNLRINNRNRRQSPVRNINRRRTSRFDRIFTFPNPTRLPLVNNFSNLSPVRIRPSVTQIRRGTELLVWNDISDNYQTHCPIDMQDFSGNDSVLRIRHCGHIFREMNLRRHFRNSTRCPICRFDIRDFIQEENDYTNETSTENENTRQNYLQSSIINTIDDNILDAIEEAVNTVSLDPSSNFLTADITYEFR